MAANVIMPWRAEDQATIADSISDPRQIASQAIQLQDHDREQVAAKFVAGSYEIATAYVWSQTMVLLKRKLEPLGPELVGELLQRPDISEFTDFASTLSDWEAISVALDLGVVSSLQSERLFDWREIVTSTSSLGSNATGQYLEMTRDDAISCLRVCVQSVLGKENVAAAKDFEQFREKLRSETLSPQSRELVELRRSPYFFARTTISALLSLLRTTISTQFENVALNTVQILPELWQTLKEPERWQIGKAYAEDYNEDRRQRLACLHSVLLKVSGFNYVPENLRSNTLIKKANEVISNHEGMDSFYKEPAAMRELARLGTSIPGPALAICVTAILCVKLGNRYRRSDAAQYTADELIRGISISQWVQYFDGRLEEDRRILYKLGEKEPCKHWVELIRQLDVDLTRVQSKTIKRLLNATVIGDLGDIEHLSRGVYSKAIGLS